MNNLIPYDPFNEIRDLLNDSFFAHAKMLKMPTTDIWTDDDKQLVVEAHLPNFDQQDIDVHVDNGFLVIRAEKHESEKDKTKRYVVRESSSSFYRRIHLPEIADKDSVKASMKQGVLTVKVAFKELPKPKKINIEPGK